jgi:hypothetical protein
MLNYFDCSIQLYLNFKRKIQRKLASLQKQVELANIKEKTAYLCLSKVTKEMEKKNLEAETLKSMTKSHEFENIKTEKKTSEQTLKIAKLEQQLETLKRKASTKIAKNMERYSFYKIIVKVLVH